MVFELLEPGRDHAKTGRELADVLGCDIRTITQQIERERRAGQPICAAMNGAAGYYLAETQEDLQAYCELIRHRAGELFATRRALLSVLKQLPGKAGADNGEQQGNQ
jgi:predicted DNA-binding transcriptional regulator YafY